MVCLLCVRGVGGCGLVGCLFGGRSLRGVCLLVMQGLGFCLWRI